MPSLPDARLMNLPALDYKYNGVVELDRDHPVGSYVAKGCWLSPSYSVLLDFDRVDTDFHAEIEPILNNITWEDNRPLFNGINSTIELFTAHHLSSFTTPQRRDYFSFSCQFRLDDATGKRTICGGAGNYLQIQFDGADNKLKVEGGPSGSIVHLTSLQSITVGQEYSMTFVNDWNKIIDGVNGQFLYIDGILDNISTTSSDFGWFSASYKLGVSNSLTEYWDGIIDMPLICSPPLSPEEIEEHHEKPYDAFATI